MDREEVNSNKNEQLKLFNTPIEFSLRCLVILNKIGSGGCELEKLMYFEYLSLNTFDIGGPRSLHAPIPNRGVQVYSRKSLVQKGITILLAKELIHVNQTKNGFYYSINKVGARFLELMDSQYFIELSERVDWVLKRFNNLTTFQIKEFIDRNIESWGGEFIVNSGRN
jgi:hypothetical protein